MPYRDVSDNLNGKRTETDWALDTARESYRDESLPSVRVPGDKSIAHRVLIASCMRDGKTHITNVPSGLDVASTIRVLRQLGAQIEESAPLEYFVQGWGVCGPQQPDRPLDCGNSGTTARLIMGVIAPWDIEVTITGDDSLRKRPMKRVTEPLERMGARFDQDRLPLVITGTKSLQAGTFDLPVSSAQVKSALLLAGLGAKGEQVVSEPNLSRNHTEIMLDSGLLEQAGLVHYAIPGDPSSASFLLAVVLLAQSGSARIENVCLNPTRLGFVRVLKRMGADVRTVPKQKTWGETAGDLCISALAGERCLTATRIEAHEIPSIIDEVPILALVAAIAQGETVFCGVDELTVKESNRLEAIIDGLGEIGVCATAREGFQGIDLAIQGRPELLSRQGLLLPDGAVFDARQDHRIALTWLVARECSVSRTAVKGADNVSVSYPSFEKDLKKLLNRIEEKGMR